MRHRNQLVTMTIEDYIDRQISLEISALTWKIKNNEIDKRTAACVIASLNHASRGRTPRNKYLIYENDRTLELKDFSSYDF